MATKDSWEHFLTAEVRIGLAHRERTNPNTSDFQKRIIARLKEGNPAIAEILARAHSVALDHLDAALGWTGNGLGDLEDVKNNEAACAALMELHGLAEGELLSEDAATRARVATVMKEIATKLTEAL